MSALALEHKAINLGQGAPDEDGPADILAVAAKATIDGPNQYPPLFGVPLLREAVANHDNHFYNMNVDGQKNVLVTVGATEGLAASILGLLNPGDEAIIIEPAYDCYLPMIRLAGATPRFIRLNGPDWQIRESDLAGVFNERTKLIIINTPLNPVGKVMSRAELELIASFVKRFDTYAICDEVYEHLVFDDHEHIPLATLPDMAGRCIKIGSAGKSFSLTGWKIGYVTAPEHLLQVIAKVHQFLTFTVPPNLQLGVAHGLTKSDEYYQDFKADLQRKRDRLAAGLSTTGLKILPTQGTYFLIADYSALAWKGGDLAFCETITREAGVAAVPLSPFYTTAPDQSMVRFCFCKDDDSLDEACRRLSAFL